MFKLIAILVSGIAAIFFAVLTVQTGFAAYALTQLGSLNGRHDGAWAWGQVCMFALGTIVSGWLMRLFSKG